MINVNNLLDDAIKAQKRAYAPYSNYPVGSALLTSDNKIIYGCNIESKAYPTTLCAERVAIYSAISQGYTSFLALAVITIDKATPCGSCRQVIFEQCGDIPIYISTSDRNYTKYDSSELLPYPFS